MDRPQTYLLSVVDVPLKADESIEKFTFATWGVDVKAVCRVPGGWRITAGRDSTPDGEISGQGSTGTTWYWEPSPRQLKNFVLVTLYGPVQHQATGGVPATFKGKAVISHMDDEHKVALSYKNIRLVRASRCP
jgi:hypothetical protein